MVMLLALSEQLLILRLLRRVEDGHDLTVHLVVLLGSQVLTREATLPPSSRRRWEPQ